MSESPSQPSGVTCGYNVEIYVLCQCTKYNIVVDEQSIEKQFSTLGIDNFLGINSALTHYRPCMIHPFERVPFTR